MDLKLMLVSRLAVKNVPTNLYSTYLEVEAVEDESLSSVL